MNCELEHNVPSQTKTENYNSGYIKDEMSKYNQFSFAFLNQVTQSSSQSEPTFDQFTFEEEAALAEGFNGLNFRETAHAFMSGNKINQIVNIFEDSTQSSNSNCFKTSSFNSNSAEEQERRTNTLEPLNLPMELEVNIHHFTPVLQGEISTQVATPAPSDVSATSESQNTRRRGRPAKVKLSIEEEMMKNDLNNIQQDFAPLKQQKNVRTTKTITKKNQLKLENKDEKFNRLSGFRNNISLVGKAVQTFAESDKEFRIQLKERLEGVELLNVTKYLTEKIKGRKNAKDQSKLANKMDVIDLLKVKEADGSEAHKKRGARAAFELFLDGEFYNIWLNAHYDKKWASQGPKGESQRQAFVVLKDEIRKNFLEF